MLKQFFLIIYFLNIYLISSYNRFLQIHKQNTCMKAFGDINNCIFIWSNLNFLALVLPVFLHNCNNVHITIYRQMSFFLCWQFCVVIFDVAQWVWIRYLTVAFTLILYYFIYMRSYCLYMYIYLQFNTMFTNYLTYIVLYNIQNRIKLNNFYLIFYIIFYISYYKYLPYTTHFSL